MDSDRDPIQPNAVEIYVEWSFHEETPGHYDFDEDRDVVGFVKIAQKCGLLVILRSGIIFNHSYIFPIPKARLLPVKNLPKNF